MISVLTIKTMCDEFEFVIYIKCTISYQSFFLIDVSECLFYFIASYYTATQMCTIANWGALNCVNIGPNKDPGQSYLSSSLLWHMNVYPTSLNATTLLQYLGASPVLHTSMSTLISSLEAILLHLQSHDNAHSSTISCYLWRHIYSYTPWFQGSSCKEKLSKKTLRGPHTSLQTTTQSELRSPAKSSIVGMQCCCKSYLLKLPRLPNN